MAGENDIDDKDDVAKKAAEIGKKLGIEDVGNDEDDSPNYDIQEVDDDEDEKIGKERVKASSEVTARKKLSSKEKRDLRRQRVQREIDSRDETIRQQQEELATIRSQVGEVSTRLNQVDRAKIDDAEVQTKSALALAEKAYVDAFSEGDGAKAAQALGTMYDAKRRLEQIDGLKRQYDNPNRNVNTNTGGAPAANAPNPKVIAKAKEWTARNDWYDASGADEDSEIAKGISAALVGAGFKPDTDEYWDELDARLEKRGIGEVSGKKGQEEDDEDDEDEIVERKPKRKTPPVSGSGGGRGDGAGKVQVKVPAAYVKNLKEMGMWDDIPTRNRMVKRYLEGVKNMQAGS